jgi:hypothetical protein
VAPGLRAVPAAWKNAAGLARHRRPAIGRTEGRQGEVSHLLLANLGPDTLTAVPPDDFVGETVAMLDVVSLQRGTPAAAPARLTLDAYAVAQSG